MVGEVFQSRRNYRAEDLEREEISPCARGTVHNLPPTYRTVESNINTEEYAGAATTQFPCPRTDI